MLRTIRNHYFYCGFERDEYDEIKKDAYVSNFVVWRVLHFLMAAVFGCMFLISLFDPLIAGNRPFYFAGFVYSVVAICLFEILRKDSLVAQLVIYLSMSVLFLIGGFISQGNPNNNATTFMVLLLVTPMFMIDKPFFMTIELSAASTVFLIWMHGVKPYDVWRLDFYNVITYTVIGCFLNVIANSVRVREFVLTRKIKIQKDTDEDSAQRIAVSIGIAIYHGHEKNYSEIFKKADTALYKAKADPQNRYCLEGQ